MSKNSNGTVGGGLGLSGVLLVVFIVLKLCKVITWSWVWVLSPLWISLILWGIILLIIIIYIMLDKQHRMCYNIYSQERKLNLIKERKK